MKLTSAMIVLSLILAACGKSVSDKELLLGFVTDAENKIISCKEQSTSDMVSDCISSSMQTLQAEWSNNLDKLEAMDDAEAQEVMMAYMQLSQTIQKEMMQIMLQQLPAEE